MCYLSEGEPATNQDNDEWTSGGTGTNGRKAALGKKHVKRNVWSGVDERRRKKRKKNEWSDTGDGGAAQRSVEKKVILARRWAPNDYGFPCGTLAPPHTRMSDADPINNVSAWVGFRVVNIDRMHVQFST